MQESTALNRKFLQQLFSNPTITIGQAIKAAKNTEQDNDVRRTVDIVWRLQTMKDHQKVIRGRCK